MNLISRPWVYPLVLLVAVVVLLGAETLVSVPMVSTAQEETPIHVAEQVTPEPALAPTDVPAAPSPTPEVQPPTELPDEASIDTTPTAPPTGSPLPAPPTETSVPPTEAPPLVPPTEAAPPIPPTEAPAPTPPPILTPEAEVLSKGGLNLRYGPGVIFDPPIGYLRVGEILDVTGRIATNEWLQVIAPNGKQGWISASPEYVQINLDWETIPVVRSPLAPAPTLLEPGDDIRVSICNRLDLFWTWKGTLGPDDYYQVEIWNRYNEFSRPIDVAWIKGNIYRYDYLDIGYHPDYRWRVTVVTGVPAGEKDWSTPENPVWEPSHQHQPISEASATWRLMVDCDPPPPAVPPTPDNNRDGDDDDRCPPGDRSC